MLFLFYLPRKSTLILISLPLLLFAISLLSFTAKPKEKVFVHLISTCSITILSESTLNKLLLLPLHHNHFCQYYPWPQVFNLLDFQQYLTQLSTPFLHLACKTHSSGFLTTSLTAPFHSCFLIITLFSLSNALGLSLCTSSLFYLY